MKISKIIKIAMQRIKQNRKRNKIVMIPLAVILMLLFMVNMIQYSMKEYRESMQDNISLRTINGIDYAPEKYEQLKKQLQNEEQIQMVVGQYEEKVIALEKCEQLQNEKTDGTIKIEPANAKACPEVINGRKIEDNDKYVIILPSKIYADSYPIIKNDKIEYINGKELLGEKLTIKFEKDDGTEFEKVFDVIGVYDSTRYSDTKTPYVPIAVIKELNEEIGYEPTYFQMNIVVDKLENIEKVNNELYEKEMIRKNMIQQEAGIGLKNMSITELNFSSKTNISLTALEIIKKMILYLIISSAIILLVVLIITNLNKSYLGATELGIMRVEGYTNKDIQKITIIENTMVCLISIIIALVGFEIIKLVMNIIGNYIMQTETIGITANKVKEQLYYIKNIPQKISVVQIAIISAIIIAVEAINTYVINKRLFSKSIKTMLKSN